MNQNHNPKESVSKTSKSQSVAKKSSKNLTAEKQKPKQQKSDKNRVPAKKVDDRHEEPVDHATKVKLIMEATMRSEEQVCWALQECDNDVDRAVDMLYENSDENSQWVKSGKKKKSKQQQSLQQDGNATIASKTIEYENSAIDEINQQQQQQISYFKDSTKEFKPRDNMIRQGSTRGRRGGSNFTNNRNREGSERFENRNTESGNGSRRGRQFDGNTPSVRGNRGRGASRNTRTFQAKDTRASYQPIETWDSSDVIKMTKNSEHDKMANNTDENWDQEFPIEDCYEEYTGSLADTKVFTPSIMTDKMNSLEKIESEMKSKASNAAAANAMVQKFSHVLDVQGSPQASQNLIQLASQNPIQMNTLTPAQTQYFNQLAQQTSESLKQQQQQPQHQHHQVSNYVSQYSNSYNSYPSSLHENNTTSSVVQSLPTSNRNLKNHQKSSSRISATSKIAANSVEMDYLNVQFSGLDLMSNNNLMDASKDKYSANQVSSAVSIDDKSAGSVSNSQNAVAAAAVLDAYSIPKSTSIVAQMKSDINSEHLSSMASNYSQSRNSVSSNVTELSKTNDHHSHHHHHHQQVHQQQQQQQHQYSAYQQKGTNSATMYQNYTPNTNYSNATNNYSQTNANYSGATVQTAAAVAAAAAAAAANNLNNPNYYQNNSFANMSQFPNYTSSLNQQSYYQNSNPLIFGTNAAGLTSNLTTNGASAYGGTAGPYNSHTGANSSTSAAAAAAAAAVSQNKLNAVAAAVAVKDQQQVYDNATASLQSSSSTSSNATPASTNLNQSATNTTTSKLSTKGMMTNLAPIVNPPYIVGQTTGAIPFYQQPAAMYTIEDLQMLQSRIQHLPTAGYYEMGYQNSTTLAAGRDATAIQNASYTMSDGRFARTDSSASPVPSSTLSQQNSNQAHQGQPMLDAAALPAAYAYYYNTGIMPGGFQYGPTVYPQMAAAAAANAHGTTNANQYAKATGYASAYNSGYDAMTQSQDFTKTNYLSANVTGGGSGSANPAGGNVSQMQNKVMNPVTTASNASNDLSIMYAKQPHAATAAATLGKINGFPSGTPQAYNLAGTQATGLGPNAAFTTQLFIPTIATHQHPNTTMIHQDSVSNSVQRSQTSNSSKNSNKQSIATATATAAGGGYPNSYWNQA